MASPTWANRSGCDASMPREFYDDPYGYIVRQERARAKAHSDALVARMDALARYERETAKYGVRVTPEADRFLARLSPQTP